jgi:Leucine Rich repeat
VSASLLPLPPLTGVVELAVYGFRFDSDFVGRLGEAMALDRLRRLDLSGNDLGDAEATVLAERFRDARPTTLNLADNLIGYRGARLARSPLLVAVELLVLSGNSLGPGGVDALTGSPYLKQLRRLELRGCNLTAKERKTFGERLRGRVAF